MDGPVLPPRSSPLPPSTEHPHAAQLPAEPVLGIDDSPTKEARLKSWLWAFVTSTFDHRDWLCTFLDVEGIEPTSNLSERARR